MLAVNMGWMRYIRQIDSHCERVIERSNLKINIKPKNGLLQPDESGIRNDKMK